MKKIVFAVTTDLNYDQRMQRICTSLATNGYTILLIGRQWPASQPLQPQKYHQHRLNCFFYKGKLFYIEYSVRLFWYLAFRSFDAYVAVDLDTVLPVFLKAKISGTPFIYDAHEYFTEVIEVVNRPVIKKVWASLEAFILTRTRFAYTVNESLAKLFYTKYKVKFSVIWNCTVLQTPIALSETTSERYLLYQGAVNEGRGLEALLKAMRFLNLKLIICGNGDIYDRLQQMTHELNLKDKIIFKGFVLPEELKKLTRQAFIGINLLENRGLNYYYSLGNKFFDYLHAGIPQLIVDFPEYSYLNDLYEVAEVVALEPETIAAAVNYLIQHPDKYSQIVQNCMVAREKLNWQKEEKKLLTFYQNVWPTS